MMFCVLRAFFAHNMAQYLSSTQRLLPDAAHAFDQVDAANRPTNVCWEVDYLEKFRIVHFLQPEPFERLWHFNLPQVKRLEGHNRPTFELPGSESVQRCKICWEVFKQGGVVAGRTQLSRLAPVTATTTTTTYSILACSMFKVVVGATLCCSTCMCARY